MSCVRHHFELANLLFHKYVASFKETLRHVAQHKAVCWSHLTKMTKNMPPVFSLEVKREQEMVATVVDV